LADLTALTEERRLLLGVKT